MTHRFRVLAALAGLLLATVAGAWMVAAGVGLRPLEGNLVGERVETAVYVAREVVRATDPEARAQELAEALQVQVELEPPDDAEALRGLRRRFRRGRLEVSVLGGPGTPVQMTLPTALGPTKLRVSFPSDQERPRRVMALGLLLLLGAAILGAWGASRWVMRPLEVASHAMDRVAAGELDHRAPEGGDAAGRMGLTFNRMAGQVAALVHGQRMLMAAVSHELRTPLTRLRLQLALLEDEGAPDARLQAMEADVDEIDQLVGELLESVRLHQGRLALHLGPVPVLPLLEGAVQRGDLGARTVHLAVDPPDLMIDGDGARLARVLDNLLSNVRRYTPEDAQVWVQAGRDAEGWWCLVRDDGPGVDPEGLAQLFEPFYRVESSRSRATGGLGLGLMIVRQIAQAHGGEVRCSSRPGAGLEVRLSLPQG